MTDHSNLPLRGTNDDSPMHDGATFIWRGRDTTRYGALGGVLCALEDEASAREFWDAYVAFLSRPTSTVRNRPEATAASNIGYLMGYYGPKERERVYGLFPAAVHPVFGPTFGRS